MMLSNGSEPWSAAPPPPQWGLLWLGVLVALTVGGNVLVCLAVYWETRLQSMANYFLVSLAIADLLVALLVMPLGMLIEVYSRFPFDAPVCVVWVSLDVSLCTASIWHMCTMSMDRFFTLKYPMRYGRNKTHTMVGLKITFVWVVSLAISSPVLVKGFLDHSSVFNEGVCAPTNQHFLLYGSILAFYVPLFIMVVTYVLTIRILYTNQKLMKKISRQHTELSRLQFSKNGGVTPLYGQYTFLSVSQDSRKPSEDLSALLTTSRRGSVSTHQESLSKDRVEESESTGELEDSSPLLQITHASTENSHRSSIPSTLSASQPNLQVTASSSLSRAVKRSHSYQPHHLQVSHPAAPKHSSLLHTSKAWAGHSQPDLQRRHRQARLHHTPSSTIRLVTATSQPHLPSMKRRSLYQRNSSPASTHSFKKISSILDLESVQNFGSLSACSSVNSLWSDFQQPVMLEKLSQIEAEMDLCLYENLGGPAAKEGPGDTAETIVEYDEQEMQSPSPSPCSEEDQRSVHSQSSTVQPDCEAYQANNLLTADDRTPPAGRVEDTPSDSKPSLETVELPTAACDNNPALGSNLQPPAPAVSECEVSSASPSQSPLKLKQCKSEPLLWRTLSSLTNPRITVSKQPDTAASSKIISKRTASNEKKASKVLGIIFCVFVALWSPFFLVNVMGSVCVSCQSAVSPALMTAITWLGWLSSLGNPIIYTMFNTAFRNTFYRILTCRYTFCRNKGHPQHHHHHQQHRTCVYSRASHSMATVNGTRLTNHIHTCS